MLLLACYILPFDSQSALSHELPAEQNIKINKTTLEKAQEAMNNKDYESAINYLDAYINSKSKNYDAYRLRANAYYAIRQYKKAQADYQSAIDLKFKWKVSDKRKGLICELKNDSKTIKKISNHGHWNCTAIGDMTLIKGKINKWKIKTMAK
jgi:tetratricopeptide (TPR) repeat protein